MTADTHHAKHDQHPAFDLLSRYKAILGAAWTHRAELAGPKRLADEAAFLPAALSLQETPVHPAPRRFAFGIIALFTIALVWSIIGKVDIVAVAPGRIIVSERTKLIQPLEASVVRRVLVKDGDTVQAGQVLVELDPTIASAEKLSVQEQLNASQSEILRTAALLQQLAQPAANQRILLNKELLRHSGLGLQADLSVNLAFKHRLQKPPNVRNFMRVHAVRHGVGVPLHGVPQAGQGVARGFGAADDDHRVLRAVRHEDGRALVGGAALGGNGAGQGQVA